MHAHDLLLMFISVSDLQMMIALCLSEFEANDMQINIKKSICTRVGVRHKFCVNKILIQNHLME